MEDAGGDRGRFDFLGEGRGGWRERGIVEKALRRGEIFFIGIWIVRSDLVSRIWL